VFEVGAGGGWLGLQAGSRQVCKSHSDGRSRCLKEL